MSESPSDKPLALSIKLQAGYMSDGSFVLKCDCSVEFRFLGEDDFDCIVRPFLISETWGDHIKTTHLPEQGKTIPTSLMHDVVDVILKKLEE